MPQSTIPLRPANASGFGGMVVSPHRLATQAAATVMARGGNAIDAAIAANAAQGMVAPETCGVGGDLFCLLFGPGFDRPRALNSSGRAGSGADELGQELRAGGATEVPQSSPAAVTVPGCVDGWLELHGSHGGLELGEVLEPAIRLGVDGFPASGEMAAAFGGRREELAGEQSAQPMYPGGRPALEGERIRRPELSRTLEIVAAGDREGFYGGQVGRAITEAVDGALIGSDLERSQAEWVDPLSVDVFGSTVWTVPPNSQGYVALLAMAMLERLGLEDREDPLAWHRAIECYRLAGADRDLVLADPEAMIAPASDLVSTEVIEGLAALVTDRRRSNTPPPTPGSGGTAYMCVVDADGLGVSLIQSNFHGIGSGRSVSGAGFLLHDRGRGFCLEVGHPNELAAGKRPLHTLSPTLWSRQGALTGLIGTRGGHIQPQLVTQLGTAIMGYGIPPGPAMAVPRWAAAVASHRDEDALIEVEPGTSDSVMADLRRRGHEVERLHHPQPGWGPMSAITIREDGLRSGAPDTRVDTAAVAAF